MTDWVCTAQCRITDEMGQMVTAYSCEEILAADGDVVDLVLSRQDCPPLYGLYQTIAETVQSGFSRNMDHVNVRCFFSNNGSEGDV